MWKLWHNSSRIAQSIVSLFVNLKKKVRSLWFHRKRRDFGSLLCFLICISCGHGYSRFHWSTQTKTVGKIHVSIFIEQFNSSRNSCSSTLCKKNKSYYLPQLIFFKPKSHTMRVCSEKRLLLITWRYFNELRMLKPHIKVASENLWNMFLSRIKTDFVPSHFHWRRVEQDLLHSVWTEGMIMERKGSIPILSWNWNQNIKNFVSVCVSLPFI